LELNGCRIGFALTGSFCTLAAAVPQMEALANLGATVIPLMSEMVYQTDTRFGKASNWIDIAEKTCGLKIIHTIKDAEPIGPKNMLDALVIAPCTGNTLGKIANGVNDTCVTMAAKATLRNGKPVVLAVSTNDGLSASAKNIGLLLNSKHIYFVPFGQDDPVKKNNSLVAKMEDIIPTLKLALDGRQIQPLLK
jgi:dipicolinate synthase subunit B